MHVRRVSESQINSALIIFLVCCLQRNWVEMIVITNCSRQFSTKILDGYFLDEVGSKKEGVR